LAYGFWVWFVERVEVPTKHVLVRIHLWGKDLGEDELVAPDESYKGVMKDVLPEGRYFINPLFWTYEIKPAVEVKPGECLVLVRKSGKRIDASRLELSSRGEGERMLGDFLARDGERGILAEVKGPGTYRLNPYLYDWETHPATEIKAEEAGVKWLRVGKDPSKLKARDTNGPPYVVEAGYRGVQEKPESSGTFYVNPFVEKVFPVNVRSHTVELTDIEFPSRDGYTLKPHVMVSYKVHDAKAAELFTTLTDVGQLHDAVGTAAEQEENEILQKVIYPLLRGYVRLEGSNFDARDFIAAETTAAMPKAVNARERLQQEVFSKVSEKCQKVGVQVETITISDLILPDDLKKVIIEREQARVMREKNFKQVDQYKSEQQLKAKEALIKQATAEQAAKLKLEQAKIKAEERKLVEESRLKTQLDAAQLQLEAAKKEAEAILARGKVEADLINLENEAKVSGLRNSVKSFPTPDSFAQAHMNQKLAPALVEIFTSDQSDFARLFSGLMTQKNGKAAEGGAGGGGNTPEPPKP
jgi:regulator of protease activity HflC (stomatin/prohibitin superfamily)